MMMDGEWCLTCALHNVHATHKPVYCCSLAYENCVVSCVTRISFVYACGVRCVRSCVRSAYAYVSALMSDK